MYVTDLLKLEKLSFGDKLEGHGGQGRPRGRGDAALCTRRGRGLVVG